MGEHRSHALDLVIPCSASGPLSLFLFFPKQSRKHYSRLHQLGFTDPQFSRFLILLFQLHCKLKASPYIVLYKLSWWTKYLEENLWKGSSYIQGYEYSGEKKKISPIMLTGTEHFHSIWQRYMPWLFFFFFSFRNLSFRKSHKISKTTYIITVIIPVFQIQNS